MTPIVSSFLALSLLSLVHMKDRPDLDAWFANLRSQGGVPCCAYIDGSAIADVDWDTAVVEGKHHYRVRLKDKWVVVSDAEVVTSPNRYGSAMAWVFYSNGEPVVRCFMPGAGG